jgi:hypothetical protein
MTKARDLGDFISDGTIAETVTADGLNLGDNEKIQLGASQDLQIYHDGSHSIVKDSGTGNLKLLAENFSVQDPNQTEQMILATPNGSVNLYYDAVKKFETTATGATVTGTVAVSGSFNATSGTFTVQSNGTDILNVTSTVMSPQTDGAISLGSATNGFNNMYLDGNAYISGDVGIGTTAIGTAALQVAGITALNGNAPASDYALNITGSSGVNGGLVCFDSTVSASTTLITTTSGGYLNVRENLPLHFYTNNTERFRIGSSGQLGIGGANYGTAGQVMTSSGSGAAPTWADAGGGGGSFEATSDGNITAGETVYLKGTGNVDAISNSYVAQSVGTGVNLIGTSNLFVRAGQSFWYDSSTVGIVWNDNQQNAYIIIGTVSSNTVTWGSAVTIASSYTAGTEGVTQGVNGAGSDSDHVVAIYRQADGDIKFSLISRSGTTATVENTYSTSIGGSSATRIVYDSGNNCWLAMLRDGSNGIIFKITRSGSTLTLSSSVQILTSQFLNEQCALVYDPDNARVIAMSQNGYTLMGTVIDASPSTPTATSPVSIVNLSNEGLMTQNPDRFSMQYDTTNNRIITVATSGNNAVSYVIFTAATSGTFTVNKASFFGADAGLTNASNEYKATVYDTTYNNSSKALYLFTNGFQGDDGSNKVFVAYLKADNLTFTDPVYTSGFSQDNSEDIGSPSEKTYTGLQVEPSGNRALFLLRGGSTDIVRGLVYSPDITQAFNYIGLAGETISSSSTGEIQVLGSVNENQTGLSIASDYYVQLDGSLGTTNAGFGFVGKALAATKILVKG